MCRSEVAYACCSPSMTGCTEALHSGQEALLAADKARGLGYKSGNVRVRVKQVDSPKGQVYVGFIDGFEAWVQRDELEAGTLRVYVFCNC